MFVAEGSFEWFRDVVGLPGEGIVLRNTRPHYCEGQYLARTLQESHATVKDCDAFFGGRLSHNGFKVRSHPNESLQLFMADLYKRVHQRDDSVNHDVSRTFARGVFAEVKKGLKVNWAAFAVVTCHWGKKIFVPHPLWKNVSKPHANGLKQLLLACRKSLTENLGDPQMKRSLDSSVQEVANQQLSKGKELLQEDHCSLVLGKSSNAKFDGPVMNFEEAGPSHAQEDIEMGLPAIVEGFQSPIIKSPKASLATYKFDTTVTIPPLNLLKILKKTKFLAAHGVPEVLLPAVMWKWKTVCITLKSKMRVEYLVKRGEENLRLEEKQKKEDLLLKKKQQLEEEKRSEKLQEGEFASNVSKMVYALLEKKFEGMIVETIMKVTPGVQKRRVGKILGCLDVPRVPKPKKIRPKVVKSNNEEPFRPPAQSTRLWTRTESQGRPAVL